MSFFRRLFGGSQKDEPQEVESIDSEQSDVAESPSAEADGDVLEQPSEQPISERTIDDAADQAADVAADISEEDAAINEALELGVTRPLEGAPYEILQPGVGHLRVAHATDQGMVRNNNQDSLYRFFASSSSVDETPDFGLFIVADGMGGHSNGEQASAVAMQTVANAVLQSLYLPLIMSRFNGNNEQPYTISEVMNKAVKDANRRIIMTVPDGGTTLTVALVMGDLAHFAHVGDSRAYIITEGEIEQLTRDHSLAQRLIELNQLSVEEQGENQHRNVLYRAIGHNEDIDVDTLTRRLPAASYILLCSDGLWGEVSNADMLETVLQAESLQAACDSLVAKANQHGGHDNISVMIFKTPSK